MPRLLLDPWSPDYEAPAAFDDAPAGAAQAFGGQVDPTVETPDWRALDGTGDWTPERVCFVDGVRRAEARVMAAHRDHVVHGLLASAATGAVECAPAQPARFSQLRRDRWLLLTSGACLDLDAGNSVEFSGAPVAGESPEDLVNALQQFMRSREAELAAELGSVESCVFADGPLSYLALSTHRVVGLVKRIILPYVDSDRLKLAGQLKPRQRTPIFLIRDGKYDRYSWFQRLAEPRPLEHPFAGVVRLEVRASLGLDAATAIAGYSARELARYASSPVRDPRAPQNLTPVGALESELRRRLGDAVLVRRLIERAIARGVELP